MPTFTVTVVDQYTANRLDDYLDQHPAPQRPLVVWDTNGGDVWAGVRMNASLRRHGNVESQVVRAFSAGSLAVLGSRKIQVAVGGKIMLHRSRAMTFGDSPDHQHSVELLDGVDRDMVALYQSGARKKLSAAKIEQMLDAETFLSAEQAVALGFADEAEAASPPKTAARSAAGIGNVSNLNPTPLAVQASASQRIPPMPDVIENNVDPNVVNITNEIVARCVAANLTPKQIQRILSESKGDLDVASEKIITLVAAVHSTQQPQTIPSDVGGGLAAPDTLRAAAADVIFARLTGQPVKANTPAEGLVGMSLLDIGARLVEANGGKIRSWNRDRLATQIFASAGYESTSDLPYLTLESGNRVLADAYTQAQSPLKQIAKRRSSKDFRDIAVLRLSEMPKLVEVGEGAEITYGARSDFKEAFKLRTFARIFALTRQAIISDDLSAFADINREWGAAAARVEADELFALIAGDGVEMSDGKTFWHSDHGNVGTTPLEISVASLGIARQKIRTTKGLDNESYLGLTPAFLLVGAVQETRAESVLTHVQATKVDDVNAFAGKMQLLVEPRIEGLQWSVWAAPSQAETLAYANLGDNQAPLLEQKDGWTTLGSEFRCVHDFGAGAVGYKGSYRNEGTGDTE